MTVKKLKEILFNFEDDTEVMIFSGGDGTSDNTRFTSVFDVYEGLWEKKSNTIATFKEGKICFDTPYEGTVMILALYPSEMPAMKTIVTN